MRAAQLGLDPRAKGISPLQRGNSKRTNGGTDRSDRTFALGNSQSANDGIHHSVECRSNERTACVSRALAIGRKDAATFALTIDRYR
jgi:hypothetical protein